MRYLFSIALVLLLLNPSIGIGLKAQDGNPYLTHYELPSGISNQNWGFSQSDNGLMFILNRKGIFSFDGYQWENLGVSGRPISIAYSKYLFYSTDEGVGYFYQEIDGTYTQKLIIESDKSNFFYSFSPTDDGLLVVSPLLICKINTGDEVSVDTVYFEDRPEVFISDFFQLNEQMYHVKNSALIYRNKPEGGHEMLAGLPIGEDMDFSFIHGNYAFFGSNNDLLYRFDGKTLTPFTLKDLNYINASVLIGGISVSDSTFVLSTLNGGCIVVNSSSGATINTLNYFSGLPDDEIFSLGTDRDGGLWISHGMGITRADLRIPISNFGFYKGISGYILSCTEYQGKLYVGSSEGLYYLDEERDYRAIDIEVKRRKKTIKNGIEDKISIEQDKKSEQSVEQKKRRFISRLFSRKSDDKKDEEELASDQSQLKTLSPEKELPPTKRRIYELQSISHSYKKVEGIQGKVRQLMVHKGNLYAATNFGLYELESRRAKLVVRNKNIVFMQESFFQKDLILLGTDEGAYYAHKQGNRWNVVTLFEEQNPLVVSILDIDESNFIVTTEFDVFLISKNSRSGFDSKQVFIPGTDLNIPVVRIVNNNVMAFTSEGLYNFNSDSKDFEANSTFVFSSNFSMLYNQREFTWVKEGREWMLMSSFEDNKNFATSYLSLLDNPNYINIANDSVIYVVNSFLQLYRININEEEKEEKPVSVFIKNISGIRGGILNPQDIDLEYSNNSLRIKISAPSYLKEGSVQFQYIISGLMEEWTDWFNNPNIDFPFFAPGDFVISIRARDILGNMSEVVNLPVKIQPPFWQTFWFFAVCAVLLLLIFIFVVKIRERTLRKEKEVLERKVKERTQTIEEQNKVLTIQRDDLAKYNKEILMQKEEIESQRDEIEQQRDQIYKQNEDITQSITYARKIQSAVMPSNEVVGKLLSDYFIMFRPRDIVSGDFYWMTERNNRVVVVAGDCTGHGVPGAFMSMMGVSFLNEIVNVDGQTQPDIILNSLREKIISTLYQMGKDGETRDGMDMSIIVFLRNTRTLMFAGAYNSLYIIRKGELIEYKADKMPVGVHPKEKVPFTLHNIKIEADDNLYIFSDGYVSQFGGPDGRKFMAKPFKELLVNINGKPIQEQKILLEDTMDRWQAAHDQIDDILVIGIAVK